MAFTVLRVPEVRRTVENELSKRERRAYDVAVDALRGEGCRAGGKRLAAEDSGITSSRIIEGSAHRGRVNPGVADIDPFHGPLTEEQS